MRSALIRPRATPSDHATARSVSIPGAPLLICGKGGAGTRFSTASRSGTWSVATRSRPPARSPSQSASRSASVAERRRDDALDHLLLVGSS